MTRLLVDTGTLTTRLGDRRRILTASLEHTREAALLGGLSDDDQLEREAQRHSLEELAVVESLLSDLEPITDPTVVDRPGVLLVGAGASGGTVVDASREELNVDLLSDRDLAVYSGLLRFALDRIIDEQQARTLYRHFPARYALGMPTTSGAPE